MPGTLYVIATPIGNLEDVTYRAIRVLGQVDRIACEDTRRTRKLLDHYGIARPTVSCHEHNERARTAELLADLRSGLDLALVSDAGTPLVSDPGYRLTSCAAAEGIPVVAVPGPSAILAALAGSGLPTDAFHFCGFLPAQSAQRRKTLERVSHESATLIFFEAPHRILAALTDIAAVFPSRPVVLARELTKIHEEYLRGTAEEIHRTLSGRGRVQGEITLLIGKGAAGEAARTSVEEDVAVRVARGLDRMEAIKQVARERGLGKREVYSRLEKDKADI